MENGQIRGRAKEIKSEPKGFIGEKSSEITLHVNFLPYSLKIVSILLTFN